MSKEDLKPAAPAPIVQEMLTQLIANPQIPKLYMQSFANFASAVDITVVVVNGNVATAALTLPYPTAKSLSIALNDAIGKYENMMKVTVLTTEAAQEKIGKGLS